jgi:hypothetical protein
LKADSYTVDLLILFSRGRPCWINRGKEPAPIAAVVVDANPIDADEKAREFVRVGDGENGA